MAIATGLMKKLEDTQTQINRSGEPSKNGRRILADLGSRTLNWPELYKIKNPLASFPGHPSKKPTRDFWIFSPEFLQNL